MKKKEKDEEKVVRGEKWKRNGIKKNQKERNTREKNKRKVMMTLTNLYLKKA